MLIDRYDFYCKELGSLFKIKNNLYRKLNIFIEIFIIIYLYVVNIVEIYISNIIIYLR